MAMTTVPIERCEVCNAEADARMRGMTLCARCALERVTVHRTGSASSDFATSQRRGRRAAFLGLFTSGFLAKMLLGGAALAAAGAVVASVATPDPAPSAPDPVTTTDAVVTATTSTVVTDLLPQDPTTTLPETANIQATSAHELVAAVQAWADCVSAAARAHEGGSLDFKVPCGPPPSPADYGLGTANPAPGQGKEPGREEAPGQVEPPGQAKQPVGDPSTADDDPGGKPAKEHRDSGPDDDPDDPADDDED